MSLFFQNIGIFKFSRNGWVSLFTAIFSDLMIAVTLFYEKYAQTGSKLRYSNDFRVYLVAWFVDGCAVIKICTIFIADAIFTSTFSDTRT